MNYSARDPASSRGIWSRPLAAAALALFAENVFYTAIIPLLPTYVERFDLSQPGAGVMLAAYSVGIIFSSIPSPWLGWRFGFRRLTALGLLLLGSTTVAFGLAGSVAALDLMRLLQGVGAGFTWIGALGWIATLAPTSRRGTVIGAALSLAVVGAVLGPVVGGIAGSTSVAAVFGVLGAAQVALGAMIAGAGARPPVRVTEPRSPELGLRTMAWPVFLLALPSLLAGVYEVLTPLKLDAVGASLGLVSAAFVASAIAEGAVAPLVGRLSDRAGRLAPLRAALLLAPALCVALTANFALAVLTALAVLAWVTIAAAWIPGMALVGDLSESDPAGASRNWALVNVAISGGVAIGSIGGPVLADAWGLAVPYLIVGAICVAAAAQLASAPAWLSATAPAKPPAPGSR